MSGTFINSGPIVRAVVSVAGNTHLSTNYKNGE